MGALNGRVKYLLDQHSKGLLTAGETAELTEILSNNDYDHLVQEALKDMLKEHRHTEELSKKEWEPVLHRILNNGDTLQIQENNQQHEYKVLTPVHPMRYYKRSFA